VINNNFGESIFVKIDERVKSVEVRQANQDTEGEDKGDEKRVKERDEIHVTDTSGADNVLGSAATNSRGRGCAFNPNIPCACVSFGFEPSGVRFI
jgi:hypothetical protein